MFCIFSFTFWCVFKVIEAYGCQNSSWLLAAFGHSGRERLCEKLVYLLRWGWGGQTAANSLSYSRYKIKPLSFHYHLPSPPLPSLSPPRQSYSSLIHQFHYGRTPAGRCNTSPCWWQLATHRGREGCLCYTNSPPSSPPSQHHQPSTFLSIRPYQQSGHQNPFTPPTQHTPGV